MRQGLGPTACKAGDGGLQEVGVALSHCQPVCRALASLSCSVLWTALQAGSRTPVYYEAGQRRGDRQLGTGAVS